MIKKISFATFLFLTVWFTNSACKKSDTTTSGGPMVNNSISPQGDPNGTFSAFFIEDNTSGGSARAAFFTTPIPLHLSTTIPGTATGTVTAVYLNNAKFTFNPSGYFYSDTATSPTFMPAVWSITGNANFPSFTYTCTTPIPGYNNGTSLPSIINRSQNLTIPTTGATNYDQIIINISDGVQTTSNLAASSSASSLVCVKDSLLKLNPSNYGNISVRLFKYNLQTIGGKAYLFITTNGYIKNNVVIQ